MRAGSRVWIQRLASAGTILEARLGGHEYAVRLDPPLAYKIWLPRADIEARDTNEPTEPPAPPTRVPAAVRAVSPGLAAAQARLDQMVPEERSKWRARVGRNLIEALRFGIVPRHAVEALSVGLEPERRLIAADLDRARASGALRILSAPYGSGKSHALDLIQSMALRENFAVARVDLDAFECQPDHPRLIYRTLARSLRVPGAPRGEGLTFLLERAAASQDVLEQLARRRTPRWHLFLGPALLNWSALGGDTAAREHLYQWISGEDVGLEEMRDHAALVTPRTDLLALGAYTTLSSHFTYLLGGLSQMATLLGYSGLVLLFDEAEHLRLLSLRMADRAIDFFKGLAFSAIGDSLPPNYLDRAYLGGRKKIPFHWRLPAHLYVAAACTPVPDSDGMLAWVPASSCVTTLPGRLSIEELATLVERVGAAYGWTFPQTGTPDSMTRQQIAVSLADGLERGVLSSLRQVVQTVVGGFDLVRGRRGWDWDRVTRDLSGFVGTAVALTAPISGRRGTSPEIEAGS